MGPKDEGNDQAVTSGEKVKNRAEFIRFSLNYNFDIYILEFAEA